MFLKTKDDIELESLLLLQKDNLSTEFKNNFLTQENTLHIIFKAKQYADRNKLENNSAFWNAAGFINMSSLDLKIIVKEMTFSSHEWTKRYFARQTCHLIYELTNDLFDILGKEFKKRLESIDNGEQLKNQLLSISKELNLFKAKYLEQLKLIRNVSSAHRDHNILVQFEVIEKINWMDTITMATSFDKILNNIGSLLQQIIDRSSTETNT